MYIQIRSIFFYFGQYAHIAHQNSVGLYFVDETYYVRHSTKIRVMCENIKRNIHFFAVYMTVFDSFFKLLGVKIIGVCAQTELLVCQINRVASEIHRGF